MLKFKSLLMLLCFCMVLAFVATPAFATVIDVNYYWYSTGGTKAVGDETWVVGDISGTQLFKAEEVWVSGDLRIGATYFPGHGEFKYDIHRLTYTGGEIDMIYDWKVYNPGRVSYLGTRSTSAASTWTAAHTADYWYWSTTTAPIDGESGYFFIYTDAPRGIVTGDASDLGGVFASGLVSGPVPEPGSMFLLGMGILGIFGLKRKVKV